MSNVATGGVAIAPGSIVIVRDAEWLVLATEETKSGRLVRVQGLSELVRGTTASFYSDFDQIEPLDPARATIKADDSPGYRRAKLWLEATIRKTPQWLQFAMWRWRPVVMVSEPVTGPRGTTPTPCRIR